MDINAAQSYAAQLYTQKTYGPKTGGDDEQKASSTATTASTTQTPTNAVTGTTGSNLSKEVIDQLMAEAQETGVSNTDTETYDGPLSIGERHHLEDIVNNPGYGASEAKIFGTGMELIRGFSSMAEAQAYFSKGGDNRFHAKLADMQKVVGERTAYYENLSGQGMPPAEIFAKLLEFNVNLPPSYDDALGWSGPGRSMSYSDYNQTRLDYLQNLISQKESASASAESTNSTEVTG